MIEAAHERGALAVVAADLLALTLLEAPGELGADVVVVTDRSPRAEDPARIRAHLLDGARRAGAAHLHEVPEPREALRRAVALTGDGDAILYAGGGTEDYREVAGVKLPYSARADARQALSEAGWPPADWDLDA